MGNSPIFMRQNEEKEEQRLRINDPRRRRKTKRGKSQTPKEKRGLGREWSAEENPTQGQNLLPGGLVSLGCCNKNTLVWVEYKYKK